MAPIIEPYIEGAAAMEVFASDVTAPLESWDEEMHSDEVSELTTPDADGLYGVSFDYFWLRWVCCNLQ